MATVIEDKMRVEFLHEFYVKHPSVRMEQLDFHWTDFYEI